MPRFSFKINPASPTSRLASRRWKLAGLAGVTASVCFAYSGVFHKLPLALDAIAIILCGWVVMQVLAPWRLMRTLTADQPVVDELSRRLLAVLEGDRSLPLKELIMDRDDSLGMLSRTIHDLAAETIASRSQTRILHRRLDDEISKETKRATAHLEKQAATDPLTGLGNRRAMEQHLDSIIQTRSSSKRLLTVMAIDMDWFKEVNDALGHDVGDKCLVFLGDLLKSSLRREDSAIRLGGDEFIVLLPDQSIEECKAIAQRLSTFFATMPWPHKLQRKPTLSIGLASSWITEAADTSTLLRHADSALYSSKQAGRSTVTAYGERRTAA